MLLVWGPHFENYCSRRWVKCEEEIVVLDICVGIGNRAGKYLKRKTKRHLTCYGSTRIFSHDITACTFSFFTLLNLSSIKIYKLELIVSNIQCYFTDFFFLKKQQHKKKLLAPFVSCAIIKCRGNIY